MGMDSATHATWFSTMHAACLHCQGCSIPHGLNELAARGGQTCVCALEALINDMIFAVHGGKGTAGRTKCPIREVRQAQRRAQAFIHEWASALGQGTS